MDDFYNFSGGIAAVLVIILDFLIIREILLSDRDIALKLAWSALILFFPLLGVIVFLVFANRRDRVTYETIV